MTGRSASPSGHSVCDPSPEGLGHSASVPNAADYRLIVARWKGRERLLEEFCNARPAVGWGRVARSRLGTEYPIRYWPRLAKHNVSIDQPSSLYATRAEAMKAATEYRNRCRLILTAMMFFRELDSRAESAGEAGTAETVQHGSVHEHATAESRDAHPQSGPLPQRSADNGD